MKKKLVAISLCTILLLIPVIMSEEPTEQPYLVDGRWIEPAIPELLIPPVPEPNGELLTSMSAGSSAQDALIQINILLALDNDFLSCYYYTPNGILNGLFYSKLQIARASAYFEEVFDVGLVVAGITTWQRSESNAVAVMDEVIAETGFYEGMFFNGFRVEALFAWTYDTMTYGGGTIFGLADEELSVCVTCAVAYWVDENIPQHEFTHLCGAADGVDYPSHYDCYMSDCVMSYRQIYVDTWDEDGVTWNVNAIVRSCHLYNDWCLDCYETVSIGRWRYWGGESGEFFELPCMGDDC